MEWLLDIVIQLVGSAIEAAAWWPRNRWTQDKEIEADAHHNRQQELSEKD